MKVPRTSPDLFGRFLRETERFQYLILHSILADPICIIPRTSLDYSKSHVGRVVQSSAREASMTQVVLQFQPSRSRKTHFYPIQSTSLERLDGLDGGRSAAVKPGIWTPSFVSPFLFDLALPARIGPTDLPTNTTRGCSSCVPNSSCCIRTECKTMPDSCKRPKESLKFGALKRRSLEWKKKC